jgi:hypothetical protein
MSDEAERLVCLESFADYKDKRVCWGLAGQCKGW